MYLILSYSSGSMLKNANNEPSKTELDTDQALDPSKIGEYM